MFSSSAYRILFACLLSGFAIWVSSIPFSRAATNNLADYPTEWTRDSVTHKQQLFKLDSGMQVVVSADTIWVYNRKQKLVGCNIGLVRKPDEDPACPSEGFTNLPGKGYFFTVEQQACSGWFYVNEFITFRYNPKDSGVWLHKFGIRYTDRRNPDTVLPEKILTTKDFGKLRMNKLVLDSLYKLVK